MNQHYRLLGLLQISLLIAAGTAWSAESDGAAKLYTGKCASCHAKDGKGNPAMAKIFKVEPAALDLTKETTLAKKDADLVKVTTDGQGKMPAYKGKLTDADIASLVAYIRTLAPKK